MKLSLPRLAAVAGLTIGALAFPIAASASGAVDPSIYRSSGQMAQLSFDIPDPVNPCLDTSGFLFAGNFTNATPGSPATSEMFGGVFVVRTDNCAGTFLSGVFYKGLLPAGAFQIDKNLTSASLVTTVTARDEGGNPVPVTLNVAWNGTGALTSGTWSSHYQRPGVNIVTHSSGDSRDAGATGTLAVGSNSLAIATTGSLQSNRSFDLFLCHSPLTGCK
jgi:hypothetical protein